MKIPGKADACDPGDTVLIPRVLSLCSRNVSAVNVIRQSIVFLPCFLFLIKSMYAWCWDTEVAPPLSVLVLLFGHDQAWRWRRTRDEQRLWSLDCAQHPSSQSRLLPTQKVLSSPQTESGWRCSEVSCKTVKIILGSLVKKCSRAFPLH